MHISFVRSTNLDLWQWEQLRTMKVGGNESATRYFQTHGGAAALASKDAKTKYTSNAAVKYKEELARRSAADARQYGGYKDSGQERALTRTDTPEKSPSQTLLMRVERAVQTHQPETRTISFRHGTSLPSSVQATPHLAQELQDSVSPEPHRHS